MPKELRQLAIVLFLTFMLFSWFSLINDWLDFSVYLIFVFAVLILLYKPLIKSFDPKFPFSLFFLAFLVKLSASAARYWTLIDIYDNVGDAVSYHEKGMEIASVLSMGNFAPLDSVKSGTSGLDFMVGILYSIFPQNMEGAFVLFATFAFIGSCFFYRAFVLAFPERPSGLYMVLIFFLPSILFWPSSLGKDAVVFLGLGLIAYGVALLMKKGSVTGTIWLLIGLGALLLVRPYTAGFVIAAAGISSIFVPNRTSRTSLGLWLASGCILIIIGFFVIQRSAEFLTDSGLRELSWQGLMDFYKARKESTTTGGSQTLTPVVVTLLGPLYAFVTILFRPFPWEAHNLQSLATSLESVLWIILIIKKRRFIYSKVGTMFRDPFIAFIIIFSITMILIQTTTGNFAIIARQRVQFLPFFLMLAV